MFGKFQSMNLQDSGKGVSNPHQVQSLLMKWLPANGERVSFAAHNYHRSHNSHLTNDVEKFVMNIMYSAQVGTDFSRPTRSRRRKTSRRLGRNEFKSGAFRFFFSFFFSFVICGHINTVEIIDSEKMCVGGWR